MLLRTGRDGSPSASHERTVVALLARRRMRRRWRGAVAVTTLIALTSGLAMFALAGARRTQSAYPRMLRAVDASTMSVTSYQNFGIATDVDIGTLPEVAQSRTFVGFNVLPLDEAGRPDQTTMWEAVGTFDGRYFDQDRFTPTAGRAADPTAVDEIVVNEFGARQAGVEVGDQLSLGIYTTEQVFDPTFSTAPPAPADVVTATIVGIGLFPDEVVQDDSDRVARLLLTPAYSEVHRPMATYGLQGLILRGGDGDIAAVKQQIGELLPPGTIEFRVTSVDTFHAQQAMRPITIALALFGAVIGLAGLVMGGQAASRLVQADRGDHLALQAFGIRRRDLALADGLVAICAIAAGTLLGAALAFLASPLAPIGPVRRIEVAPGFDVDLTVLFGGAALVLTVLGLIVAVAAWRGARTDLSADDPAARRIPRWRTAAARALPAPGRAGLGLTFGTGARSGVPARSVIVGAITGVAALVVALTFTASLDLLVRRPVLYGWNWGAAVIAADGYGNLDRELTDEILAGQDEVAGWSGAWFGSDLIDGVEVPLVGVEPRSAVLPPITDGRPIEDAGEVVLGATTARSLGVEVGDDVEIGDSTTGSTLEVVGIATFPALGPVHVARTSLGVGALVAPELVPGSDLDITATSRGDFGPNVLLVRFDEGVPTDAAIADLGGALEPLRTFTDVKVLDVQRPAEIVNSSSVGGATLGLAATLLVGSLLSLALAVGTFVRRRRHDLAVLRTLGFTSRQLWATVSWQAVVLVTPGVLLGVPLGAVLGSVLWDDFATRMDAIAAADVPARSVLGIVAASYLVALAAAALHARRAARLNAAQLLRTE